MVTHRFDWLHILNQCKCKVQEQISPLLASSRQPQPDLGIGAGGDPIKRIDLAAEEAIVNTLVKHGISFTLISEESGVKKYGKHLKECYVTADPVDGTTNLTRGIPFYATSIAISTKPMLSTVHAALVADLFHDVTYTAQKGKGAYRNGKEVTPSDNTSLEEAVIGIDLNSYKIQRIAPQLTNLIQNTKHVRHFGANALELCYVADGTTDSFIDIRGKLRATDMAAGWLVIKEAGAEITSAEGKALNVKLSPKQKVEFVASANSKMHAEILKLIKQKSEEE
ncbi:MAG: inositol monophosphatase family protein [Candidatus Bathyarchaeia archaeon]